MWHYNLISVYPPNLFIHSFFRTAVSPQHLVFSYYKDDEDEAKEKPLKKFLIDSCTVSDYPIGANNYTYVIKLLLGPLYNDREILLCFDEKGEHRQWLKAFTDSMNSNKVDSLEVALRTPVRKYEMATQSPLQVELERLREERDSESSSQEQMGSCSSQEDGDVIGWKHILMIKDMMKNSLWWFSCE